MERIDGYTVELYGARFTGNVDLDEALRYGSTGVCLVFYKVGPATFKENAQGDMKRVNTVSAEDVLFLDDDHVDEILVKHGFVRERQLSLPSGEQETPAQDSGSPVELTSVDQETGEVLEPAAENDDEWEEDWSDEPAVLVGSRVTPSPSTVGASQAERDPMLQRFLESGK